MDFDDVLVNLSAEVFSRIRSNWRVFNRWFVDSGPLSAKEINDRKIFMFSEFLLKKEFLNITPKEYTALQIMINSEIKKRIFSDIRLYDSLEPTLFAKKTLLNEMFIGSDVIKKVFIVSRNITPEQRQSKENFIKKYFNNEKIEFIDVRADEDKSDAITEHGIDWNLFVDDELRNIRNIAEKTSSLDSKEFLIPKYGYNKLDKSLQLLIEGKGGAFTYYDPYKSFEFSLK